MRIKLTGEITAERLAEALQQASDELEAARTGTKIYGANLYLTPFDADGLPFDLVDDHGKSVCITITAKTGELVKPALTADGERRRNQASEEVKRQTEDKEKRHQASMERVRQIQLESKRACARAKAKFEYLNELTAQFLKDTPEHFVGELNKTIQAVWDEFDPIEPHGKNKGQPKPRPSFDFQGDELILTSPTWRYPKPQLNPIGKLHLSELEPVWRNAAWFEVVKRIAVVMEELSKQTTMVQS